LELELTYSCNYACNYCYNPLNREFRSELNSDTWCNVIDEAIELGVEHLSFTGGEPLLKADKLFKCLEHLRAKDQRIATRLVTNGSLISDELTKRLKQLGLDIVQYSLHFDRINRALSRLGALDVDRTISEYIEKVNTLKGHGLYVVGVVVLSSNYLNFVSKAIDEVLKRSEIDLMWVEQVFLAGHAMKNSGMIPSQERIARIISELKEIKEHYPSRLLIREHAYIQGVVPLTRGTPKEAVVTPVGDVYRFHSTIGRPEHFCGNVTRQGLKGAWLTLIRAYSRGV